MMSYKNLDEIFSKLDADYSVAEAHGIAVGMLCVELRADIDNWLQALLIDRATLDDEDLLDITELYDETQALLSGEDEQYGFDLLLPELDEPLYEQVEALRDWCHGFLLGIGYAHSSGQWPGEVGEVIADIIEFTKIDNDSQDEEDANALMEVHEYLRVAVLTIRDFFIESAQAQQH